MILEKPHTERNREYMDWVATKPCAVCKRLAEPHHEGKEANGGMGMKCSDYETVPLCRDHHQYRHLVGRRSFWEFWGIDPQVIITRLNLEWDNAKKTD